MSKYRASCSDSMTAMINTLGDGKSQEFFLTTCRGDRDEAEYVLECEINAMPNSELIDLMELAGVIRVADSN